MKFCYASGTRAGRKANRPVGVGAILRRDSQPDRRVIGVLDHEPAEGTLRVLVVERIQ
jgi:hypothetical protein